MATRLLLFLLAALTGLIAAPVLAQDAGKGGKDEKGIEERWKDLDKKTREERRKILRKLLEGKSEKEKEEILRKLKELERKAMRDRLREKHRQYEEFKGRLLKSLSPPARDRYDKLAPEYQRGLIFHCMHRISEVGKKRFDESLTPEQKKELEGLSRGERWKRIVQITDGRVLEAQTLEIRKELDALPENERKERLETLRTEYVVAKFRLIETEVVFPETAKLLRKPKAEVEKFLKDRRKRGFRGRGRGRSDQRPHHRPGTKSPDKELHDLLHKLPEKHRKAADEEYIRIVTKIRDGEARKKALEELKTRLRSYLED